ncbi:hypothetical protein Q3G72_005499 [Acer saccharum]|nr:hypothetical protein Q3G72_005499 [Acer saccharum]
MRPDQLNDSPCHYTGFASCETSDKRADQAHNTLKQRSKIILVVLPFGSVWTVAGGGDVLCVFSSVIVDGTSAAAELAAILQACKCCASAMCPTNLSVIIESDSSSVVSWVNSVEGVGHIRFSDTILEIREILFRLKPKVSVRFVNSGNNAAADFLAKQGAINGLVQLVWSA